MSTAGRRIRVGVLLGGASAEREISLASGRMVADHLPPDRYEVVLFEQKDRELPAAFQQEIQRAAAEAAPAAVGGPRPQRC